MFDCFGFFNPCCNNQPERKRPECCHHRCDHRERECDRRQDHVHEYLGSTQCAECGFERHNHRFAGVTGPVIRSGNSHIHEYANRTDTTLGHFHNMRDFTGPAVNVGNGRHIHFARGNTTFNDGHFHDFNFATLIEDPTGR